MGEADELLRFFENLRVHLVVRTSPHINKDKMVYARCGFKDSQDWSDLAAKMTFKSTILVEVK